jgi:glycerol-3-phosphate acyltransferase PlsY
MLNLLINALVAYLIGSLSGSLIIGRLKQVDIRKAGSGNAGGTNAFRTQGFVFALAVVVFDVGKGALAAWALPGLAWFGAAGAASIGTQALVCGFAAVVGHCYPLWHGFRGGKGAATAIGAILVIQPLAVLPMIAVWLLSLTLTGWVGLSTMLAALSLVPALWWLNAPRPQWLFGIALAVFIVFMHRSNIRNMASGTEYRFERAMFRNWIK